MNINSSTDKLVIAVSDCALFNLDGIAARAVHGREHVDGQPQERPPAPGTAFHFVRKLLALNETTPGCVEVILLSRASSANSLYLFQALAYYGLAVSRAGFTADACLHHYARAFGAHLFLSTVPEEVRLALADGIPAATILRTTPHHPSDEIVRIAFDGDAVLFSDEAERIYTQSGLAAFNSSETQHRHRPLEAGPLRLFLSRLQRLQALEPLAAGRIRTALVTARAAPAHERVLRTLHGWGIHLNDVLFLGGMDKGPFLSSFGADLFFDDQQRNCESAASFVPTAHVPYGIKNSIHLVAA